MRDKERVEGVLADRGIQAAIESGNVNALIGCLADLEPPDRAIKICLRRTIEQRAVQQESAALEVGSYSVTNDCGVQLTGSGSYEIKRADNLRRLAKKVSSL